MNLTDAICEVFFTRLGWIYAINHSINTHPVPWRIKLTGGVSTDNAIKGAFEIEISLISPQMSLPMMHLTSPPALVLTILYNDTNHSRPREGIDFGQLRRNIHTSVTNYTGLRPLQIGNIQVSGLCSMMSIGYIVCYTQTCAHTIYCHTYNA